MSVLAPAAPPTSRRALRTLALKIRSMLGYSNQRYLPVEELLEFALPELAPGFEFDVCNDDELGSVLGLTELREKVIYLQQSVYERAIAGVGRDRFTIAHEIGHAALHADLHAQRPRLRPTIKTYEDPEWQANTFAAELLVSAELARGGDGTMSPEEMTSEFGVSLECARIQYKALQSYKC